MGHGKQYRPEFFFTVVAREFAQEKKYADSLHKIKTEQDIVSWMLGEILSINFF